MQGEARLLTRSGEAEYENAKAEIADGKYRSGISRLERLVADRTIDAEIREEALLSVAETHGSWLNPFRDYDKAMEYCEQFLKDYPESAKREHVEQLIEQYRESAAQQP
jgi:outer membrane protein assembly factor BamD (BamD/ComL family)